METGGSILLSTAQKTMSNGTSRSLSCSDFSIPSTGYLVSLRKRTGPGNSYIDTEKAVWGVSGGLSFNQLCCH